MSHAIRTPDLARRSERGVVLILAIIVLVAMSLAALALMRSTLTGNRVAGNLAFQQSATLAGDTGIESAVAWLEQQRGNALLSNNASVSGTCSSGCSGGYFATRSDPAAGQSWDAWWAALPTTGINQLPVNTNTGNTVQYVIHRLCASSGTANISLGCQIDATVNPSAGGSQGDDQKPAGNAVQYYYRIIAHITGARGTSSYVQAVVAM